MCKNHNPRKIDKCMMNLIGMLNRVKILDFKILACCCGHKKYPMTIVYTDKFGGINDLLSGVLIPRKRRFYKKDKQGYYFIPEVIKYWRNSS